MLRRAGRVVGLVVPRQLMSQQPAPACPLSRSAVSDIPAAQLYSGAHQPAAGQPRMRLALAAKLGSSFWCPSHPIASLPDNKIFDGP